MDSKKAIALKCLILTLAVVCIGYGVYRGECPLIFRKATEICYQCIGIG